MNDDKGSKKINGGTDANDKREGIVAKTIEDQTAKLPSDVFLWAAGATVGASLVLKLTGKEDHSRFVGQWVAPILLMGVYNKIVKVAGSDQTDGLAAAR